MAVPLRGRVHGKSIELDDALPQLEGQQVLVVVEPVIERLPPDVELRAAWDEWAARADPGPIDDEGEPEFP